MTFAELPKYIVYSMEKEVSAADIELLTGLESIRRRPEMYLGDLSSPALNTKLFFQSLCHAIDDVMEERCTEISMLIGPGKGVVSYNSGMPLNSDASSGNQPIAIMFLCVLSACHNRKKHLEVGSEFCELGLAVLNAMCADLLVETCDDGRKSAFHFQNGILTHPIEIIDTEESDNTQITMQLDGTILCNNSLDIEKVRSESIRVSKKYSIPIDIKELPN